MIEGRTVLDGIRQKVFLDRYALKDQDGNPLEEYPEQMWKRVAHGIASVEKDTGLRTNWEERFYDILKDFQFVPAGRILTGAGTPHKVTYYNCYVIPSPPDSREGIIDTLKTMTEIMARGGGVGINFSTLRPKGSYIKTVNGTASGPCSWIQLFSVATGEVIQQGGSRRGALMAMLDDNHPDIEEFITCKRTPGWISHANLSICISDDFMNAVKKDNDWRLVWNGKVKKVIKARYLWDLICQSAWESAEPGLVFMERYNKQSNTWYYEKIHCVNPCGEQGLGDWGVCNLGAINLAAFVENGVMDYDRLSSVTTVAMRFLDNVIDATDYFIDENKEAQLGTRRTGIGTMGLADALIKMGVTYGSDESLKIIDSIYGTIMSHAYAASVELASEKGSFPKFDREKYLQGEFIQKQSQWIREAISIYGIRNAVLLTQAPTGTTSLLAGVSSGIEPVYDFAMIRRDRTGEHVMYHPLLQAWRDEHPDAPTPIYFVSSKDLTPEEHVRVQAKIQEYTDASISKTVNAPNEHTIEQVKKLYMLAYEQGCKGVTYYRDGSRDAVLTRVADEEKKEPVTTEVTMKSRPEVMSGYTIQVKAPEGKVNVTINSDEDGPLEVFVNVGKAGSDIAALSEALGRLISLTLQLPNSYGQDQIIDEICKQLRGIGGSRSVGFGENQVRSLPDAVARTLEFHGMFSKETTAGVLVKPEDFPFFKGDQSRTHVSQEVAQKILGSLGPSHEFTHLLKTTDNMCPDCGSFSIVREEGCKKCHVCGYSEC